MAAFITNKAPFFSYVSNISLFLFRLGKIVLIRNMYQIWNYLLIWADEACHFTDFSNITSLWRHNYILFENLISDLKSEYQN